MSRGKVQRHRKERDAPASETNSVSERYPQFSEVLCPCSWQGSDCDVTEPPCLKRRNELRSVQLSDRSCRFWSKRGFRFETQHVCHTTDHRSCSATEPHADAADSAGPRSAVAPGGWGAGRAAASLSYVHSALRETLRTPGGVHLYLPGGTSKLFHRDFQKDRLRKTAFPGVTLTLPRRGFAGAAMSFPEALPSGGGSWWE